MSQVFSQVARQLQTQQQRLTPQLIQAMNILQLNAMQLESRIAEELDGNPALELAPGEDEAAGPTPEAVEPPPASERTEGEQALDVEDGRDFERLENLNAEYGLLEDDFDYRPSRSPGALAEDGDAKLDAMANTAARAGSLREHLLEQWALVEVGDEIRAAGSLLIDNVDDTGRLRPGLDELRRGAEPPVTENALSEALARVQQLDPPGVAARDLPECLLLQLESMPRDTELERRIIEEHLDDLQKNRLPQIARALEVDISDVKEALRTISRLAIHPGLEVSGRGAPPIVPDVLVDFDEELDRYTVRLTRANQRELRISQEFREAIEKSRGDKQAREFIKQKLDAAGAIIDALRYRRERLLDVSKAVVEAQREFLDHGEQHLKVLRMNELAERFECDPSTISRTVDEKWMQTPRGIFPLRKFFTGGTESESGEALGWDSVKAKVQEIVAAENKNNPLNDDEIVEKLAAAGIDLKRRTVAKYRAQLDIPTARQRKQF